MKRFVSFLLIFCMVLSILPCEVLAADIANETDAVIAGQELETEQDRESEEQESAIPEEPDRPEEAADAEEPPASEEPAVPEGASELEEPSETEAISFPEGMIGCEGDDISHSAPHEPAEDNSIDPDQLAAMCPVPYAAGETVRYSVLVLDTSASSSFEENGRVFYTADTAIEYVRESAKKFVSDVRKADGINYVAVVEYKNAASNIVSGFTTDYDTLNETIDGLYSSDNVRSVAYGLQKVNFLLDAIPDPDAIKNVVLFTTGMTNEGPYSYSGKYNEDTIASNWRRMDTQVRLYAYSNSAIAEAETIKRKATLYTVGLFQVMEEMPQAGRDVVEFFKLFTRDMATSEDYFYDVKDPSQLEFVFGEIADSITKGSGKFKYAGQINQKRDQEAVYYYDDGYFFKDATQYDRSLSTMSLCLELSTWSSSSANRTYLDSGKKGDKIYDKWYDPKLSPSDPAFWQDTLVNVKTLLLGNPAAGSGYEGIGFHDFAASADWQSTPTKDSIGVVAARKQISAGEGEKEYTLVALVVRGGGYGSEWSSNFTLGRSGEHAGFRKAKEDVLEFLSDYVTTLREDESKDMKLWVVGFSRGGITANMVTGELNQRSSTLLPGTVSLRREDTYCYVFEPPMGIMEEQDDGSHRNIHNIVNQSDLVPLVAPDAWSFTRYNAAYDWALPVSVSNSKWSGQFSAMKQELKELGYDPDFYYTIHDSYDLNQFNVDTSKWLPFGDPLWWNETETRMTRDVINDGVTTLLDEFLQGRTYYSANTEYGMRQIIGIFMHYAGALNGLKDYVEEVGGTSFSFDEFMDNLANLFTWDSMKYILKPAVALNFDSPAKRVDKVKDRAKQKVLAVFGGIGGELAEMDIFANALADGFGNLCGTIAWQVVKSNTRTLNNVMNFFEILDFGTIIKNIVDGLTSEEDKEYPPNQVFCAHYPEICLAWVRSQDPNYSTVDGSDPVSSITRIIRINCPVDAMVYDGNGQLVASIRDDVPQELETSILSTVSVEGEKMFYLPGDEDYRVELSATDDGTVCYSVSEYNFIHNDTTRARYYLEIPVSEGDILTGAVPKITDDELGMNAETGSTAAYRLTDRDNVEIPSSSDTVPDTLYEVTVEKRSADGVLNDGEIVGGTVTGAGTFLENDFAQIMAQPLPGAEFHGFTVNGVAVEDVTEETHAGSVWYVTRFRVASDTTVVAEFEDITLYTLSFASGEGGEVTNEDGYLGAGMTIQLQAVPYPGYQFAGWTSSNGAAVNNPADAETEFVMPDSNVVLTASFVRDTSDPDKGYAIVFDANGGTLTGSSMMRTGADGKLPSLPSNPTCSGSYSFDGWYTAPNGGTRITTSYVFTGDATVYAQWTAIAHPDSAETYYISVQKTANGEIIPSVRYAEDGERVTLTVRPDAGYELNSITVTNVRGREITLRDLGDNRYSFTMPNSRVSVDASFTQIATDTSETPAENELFTGLGTPGISGIVLNPAAMPFTDVHSSDWFFNSVEYMWKHYLMSGVSDTQFAPSTTTSRAMIWTVLARMNNVRTDINSGSTWYEKGMLWAMEQGVTDGSNPMNDITREQLATMLWRNAGSPGGTADLNRFSDSSSVSGYAASAIRWAVANGVLQGSDGKLNPKGTATRAQVAAMVQRYGERIGA